MNPLASVLNSLQETRSNDAVNLTREVISVARKRKSVT